MNRILLTAPVAAILLLAGCGMPAADAPATPDPAPTAVPIIEDPVAPTLEPEPEPEPEPAPAMPDLTGTEVVLVTARFEAHNGAQLDVAMTTYYPVTVGSPEGAAILATLDAAGDSTQVSDAAALAASGAILQLTSVSVTSPTPGIPWPAEYGPTPRFGPGLQDTTIGLALTSAGRWPYLTGPGEGWGVAALSFSSAPIDLTQWPEFWTFYGADLLDFEATATSCDTVLTALAQESRYTDVWEQSPYACTVGVGH